MSNPPSSIARFLDLPCASRLIGLSHSNEFRSLPVLIECPFCQSGSFQAMEDHVLGGDWWFCHSCRVAGDLIEIAARKAGLTIAKTIEMFAENECLTRKDISSREIEAYETFYVDRRNRTRQFWNEAKTRPSVDVDRKAFWLAREFGLGEEVYRKRWTTTQGLLFGIAEKGNIEELFGPASYGYQERLNPSGKRTVRRGGGTGKTRVFTDAFWGECIAIPHLDLPGRPVGFTFLGRYNPDDSKVPKKYQKPAVIYRRFNIGQSNAKEKECGLGWLHALPLDKHETNGEDLFIFLDAAAAVRLQARSLRTLSLQLPILVAHVGTGISLLKLPPMIRDRNIFFCGPPKVTIPLAAKFDGKISFFDTSEAGVIEAMRHCSPFQVVSSRVKAASRSRVKSGH